MADHLLRIILAHLEQGESFPILVIGDVGAGKTRACSRAIAEVETEGYEIGGVLSPRLLEAGVTVGYDVVDLKTGERTEFLRSKPPGERKIGRFYLRSGGMEFASAAISRGVDEADLVFLDEVGRMELKGLGLAESVEKVLASRSQGVYLLRRAFINRFRESFAVSQYDEVRV